MAFRISWKHVPIVSDFRSIMRPYADSSDYQALFYERSLRPCTRFFVAYVSQRRFAQVLLWEAPYDTLSVDVSHRLWALELMCPAPGIYTSRGLRR